MFGWIKRMFGGGGETHEITPINCGVGRFAGSLLPDGWGAPNKLILTEAETAKAMSESRRTGNRAVRIKTTKDIRGHIVTLNGTFRIDEPRKKLPKQRSE